MSVRSFKELVETENNRLDIFPLMGIKEEEIRDLLLKEMGIHNKERKDFILVILDPEDQEAILHKYLFLYGNRPQALPDILNGVYYHQNDKDVEGTIEEVAGKVALDITELGLKDKMKEKYPDLEKAKEDAKECAKIFSGKGILGITRALQLYHKTGKTAEIPKVIAGAFLNQYQDTERALEMLGSCDNEFQRLNKRYKGAYAGFREAYSILSAIAAKEYGSPEKQEEEITKE